MNMWLENMKAMGLTPKHHNNCGPRIQQGQNRARKPGSYYRPAGLRAPHDVPK